MRKEVFSMKKENVFIGGAVFAAIASSLCCVLPLVAVVFGLGAFGAASAFETLRPYLLALAFAALAFSFYRVYFRREACAEGQSCATKPVNKINQLFLWGWCFGYLNFCVCALLHRLSCGSGQQSAAAFTRYDDAGGCGNGKPSQ
ncbi:MAG TPA: mercuric transporter MerT family protein [Pyrinomonadaceae bacterium]|nr:mercuric transporter MerT family protein [Pyrinomonadaceae bacterium]